MKSCVFVDRYDLKDTSKIILQDIQFIAAMGPPGGGRNDITARFMRHFNIMAMNPFNDDTMTRIFSILLNTYFRVSIYIVAIATESVSVSVENSILICDFEQFCFLCYKVLGEFME